jgi:hypothetical protein
MFKFNTLSSGLVQSFHYDEITEAAPATRLMIKYLKLTADGRYHYLKVNEPEVWATKIIASRDKFKAVHVGTDSHATPSKSELLEMLDNLRTAGVMTEEEVTDKRRIVLG